jgi:glycosyltransferase involved in cell wall biosynthesis
MESIIIPAYNEELRIKSVVLSLSESMPEKEILVVCDGADETKSIVKDISVHKPNIRVINFDVRLGKGGAIVEGFKTARGERIGFVDADESVSPKDIKDMFNLLESSDGIIASRRMKASKILVEQPLKRRVASRIFNIFVRSFFGLPFKDTQCGAKVFKREAIYSILDELETKGFEIDVEILWRLKNKGYNIIEHPIAWKHSEGSKFSLKQSKHMLISLLQIRFK